MDYASNSDLPYGYCGDPQGENAPNSTNFTTSYCTDNYLNTTSLRTYF